MTDQQQKTPTSEQSKDRFQAEFEALPLDKKFASLFKMEAATLTETFEYVFNSPMEAVGKVGDAISDIAVKVEAEFKKASRANQAHCEPEAKSPPTSTATKPKGRRTQKNPPPQSPTG